MKYYIFPHQIAALFNLAIFIYVSGRFYSIPLISKARGRYDLLSLRRHIAVPGSFYLCYTMRNPPGFGTYDVCG